MLRGETEEVQRRIQRAVIDRDGSDAAAGNFRFFDTICGATQERQDALRELLDVKMDLLLVVGGYNSSNTSHLAEMGEEKLPTYFVLNASRLLSRTEIKHYNLHEKREVVSHFWLPNGPAVIGITAGASCPNNLIEETLIRLFELRYLAPRARAGRVTTTTASSVIPSESRDLKLCPRCQGRVKNRDVSTSLDMTKAGRAVPACHTH